MVFQHWRLRCSGRFKNGIQLVELGKSARARPGNRMTDFRGWYSGCLDPGGRRAPYRMRVSTDNLVLSTFMAISGMSSFCKIGAYPSL